jgi:hypothetical protein
LQIIEDLASDEKASETALNKNGRVSPCLSLHFSFLRYFLKILKLLFLLQHFLVLLLLHRTGINFVLGCNYIGYFLRTFFFNLHYSSPYILLHRTVFLYFFCRFIGLISSKEIVQRLKLNLLLCLQIIMFLQNLLYLLVALQW